MKKRILPMLLTLALCLGLIPMTAAAEDVSITWLPEGTELSKYDHKYNRELNYVEAVVCDDSGRYLTGILDLDTGKTVEEYNWMSTTSSDGLVKVGNGDFGSRKYGFIDATGKVVIPLEYDDAGDFSDGLAKVRIGAWGASQSGYVDTTGKVVIPIQYADAGDFSEGLAWVKQNGKYGFIDTTGKAVIPPEYEYAFGFSDGVAIVKKDGKWGFIDKTGKAVVPLTLEYDNVWSFTEGLAWVEKGGMSGLIDKTGKVVIPTEYNTVCDLSEGLMAVWKDGKCGVIDKTGKVVVPVEYDGMNDFSDGLAAVMKDWKFGFVDKTGKVVIPMEYGEVGDFSGGLAAVMKDWKWGFIDKTGKAVVPVEYDDAGTLEGGLCYVAKDGRYGVFDPTPSKTITSSGILPQAAGTAHASTQNVNVDGKAVEFQMYALKDASGSVTNYVKLRDVAFAVNGTPAQFSVGWSAERGIYVTTGEGYTKTGTEMTTPFSGNRAYTRMGDSTDVNGVQVTLQAFTLKDDAGGAYTYYQLRDLGKALGFNVGWSSGKGVFIETDKPYTDAD